MFWASLREQIENLTRRIEKLESKNDTSQAKYKKVLLFTATDDEKQEFQIPEGLKISGPIMVTTKEKADVGIEHLDNPAKFHFLVNYQEGILKPTKRLKTGCEIIVTAEFNDKKGGEVDCETLQNLRRKPLQL